MTAPNPVLWKMGCIEVFESETYKNLPKYYVLHVNGVEIARTTIKPRDFKQWAKQKIRARANRRINRARTLENQLMSKKQEIHDLNMAESIL